MKNSIKELILNPGCGDDDNSDRFMKSREIISIINFILFIYLIAHLP